MGVKRDLEGLSAAEDFFDYLGVPYEPEVLRVNRLHIMRQLGNLLKDETVGDSGQDEAGVRDHFREKLSRAYADLSSEGPLARRLFKVHQDAVKPKPASPGAAFVPLSNLVGPEGSTEP